MGVAAMGTPGFAAMIPQGFGAGVGRVGPYYEQGNWYRGGAVQMLFIAWLYGEQNQVRPMFPPNTSQEDLIRASKEFDLAQQLPPVDWSKALTHLPEQDIIKAVDGPHGIFADRMEVSTGGAMIKRTPNDPAWYRGGLWHDDHADQRAGFLVHVMVRRFGGPESGGVQFDAQECPAGDRQTAIRDDRADAALLLQARHEDTVVGERSMGDARLDYDALTYGWFDHFLKGEDNHFSKRWPQGPLLHHGDEQVAVVGYVAAAGRAADDVLSLERRQSEQPERRRRADDGGAERR